VRTHVVFRLAGIEAPSVSLHHRSFQVAEIHVLLDLLVFLVRVVTVELVRTHVLFLFVGIYAVSIHRQLRVWKSRVWTGGSLQIEGRDELFFVCFLYSGRFDLEVSHLHHPFS
jgi:hypothetical protein